jgi:L-histidine Nalpha-methyltransferase
MADVLAPGRVVVESHLEDDGLERMVQDVRDGLTRTPKELPPKYFYDARGSELFDRITQLPEYYPTRVERALLNRHAPSLVERSGARELVELGSGTASKTRALLYAMAGANALDRYVPFDVDRSVVERCAAELVELYPGLAVHGVVGDFERHLDRIPAGENRLIAFLGGTIGNLHPGPRARFLCEIRALLWPADRFLLGAGLVTDRAVMEAAYDDSAGVTREFNRNVLRALNAALGADFDPEAFEHVARFDSGAARIEMVLRSRRAQRVSIPGADLEVTFQHGEELRTEVSAKFTAERLEDELADAGMDLEELLTDDSGLFALALASPR